MLRFLVAAAAALAFAQPAGAQREWRHEASGISVPREIGEMRLGQERDNSNGAGTDIILQYGGGDTVVTLYVYRSAYPNAALWFERTRLAMRQTVAADAVAVAPRSFTLGGGSAPNGLREELDVPSNSMGARSTAVAIAQAGEWIVKARISSRQLDRAGVAERMDQLLGAVRLGRETAPNPLAVPGPCPTDNRMSGDRVRRPGDEAVAAAVREGAAAYAEARGRAGLAADPNAWCRDTTEVPLEYGTVYRRRDGAGWVTLLGDSGVAIAANRMDLPGPAGAALFASSTAATRIAGLYEDLPHPNSATVEGIPVLVGQERGLAEVPGSEPPR